MDLILCHQTADFDALGAAVGLSRLKPGSKIVLTGGAHPSVRDFLALHRNELATLEQRSVNPEQIRSLAIPDAQKRDRLGTAAQWLDLPQIGAIAIYDHHLEADCDIPATECQIEPIGATTTMIVERLQQQNVQLAPLEATVMALGIHADTGSLVFEQTTPRDIRALAWLMEAGASLESIREYSDRGLSPQLQQLLGDAIETLQVTTVRGYTLGSVLLETASFVPGLSSLAMYVVEFANLDVLLLAHQYYRREGEGQRLAIVGRSRRPEIDLNRLLQPLGGGGHASAASVTLREVDAPHLLDDLIDRAIAQLPHPPAARDLMSSPVRTIRPQTTIDEAQRILLRYGHSGLSVVNERDELVGIISRRDLDIALHHGFSHAPVKAYMSQNLKTIAPETPLPEIEALMVAHDVGRLPVLADGQLVGIVTRTDVLRQRHQDWDLGAAEAAAEPARERGQRDLDRFDYLKSAIPAPIWDFLMRAATAARERGWHLYLVGGAVRDLLLVAEGITAGNPFLQDLDLVVDGFHRAADAGAGMELAKALQTAYPAARLEVHGAFQTAALLWHKDGELDSLAVDIATARTEFYPYPAANPEVEASSIRQDLYRRDFSINALALRLSEPNRGELLDFFGGMLDLRSRQVRVLHANSFIEDPTRIYRAVRFAVRLGFSLEAQTEQYIRYAIESGAYDRLRLTHPRAPALTTRLKAELKYILEAHYWKRALRLLADLGALRCLHPELILTERLWWQIRFLDRCLQRFDSERRLTHDLLRLEALIAYLPFEERAPVAANLQLSGESLQRLESLGALEREVLDKLNCSAEETGAPRPSQVVLLLRPHSLALLVLLMLRTPRRVRRQIWRYLVCWANLRPPLNGNDLKALGYQPGPQFKEILDELLIVTVDGKIRDRAEAEAFLKNWPSSKSLRLT